MECTGSRAAAERPPGERVGLSQGGQDRRVDDHPRGRDRGHGRDRLQRDRRRSGGGAWGRDRRRRAERGAVRPLSGRDGPGCPGQAHHAWARECSHPSVQLSRAGAHGRHRALQELRRDSRASLVEVGSGSDSGRRLVFRDGGSHRSRQERDDRDSRSPRESDGNLREPVGRRGGTGRGGTAGKRLLRGLGPRRR